MGPLLRSLALVVVAPLLSSCGLVVFLSGGDPETLPPDAAVPAEDGGQGRDDGGASSRDAGAEDAAAPDDEDAGLLDGGAATDAAVDASVEDSGPSGADGGDVDAGNLDAGNLDAGNLDAGNLDAGNLDAGPLWPNGATHRMKLTFKSSPGVGVLTDFPVLVRLPASFPFDLVGQGGVGLTFTDEYGATELRHEVDTWEATAGLVWVKVPDVARDGDDHIWLYFGGAQQPPPPPSDVWSNGFAAVWHLGDDLSDATGQVPDFTNNGAVVEAAGVSGSGSRFSNNAYLESISSGLSLPSEWTLETWAKFDSITAGIYSNMLVAAAAYDDGYVGQWPYWFNLTGALRPLVYWSSDIGTAASLDATTAAGIVVGAWHHLAATKASDGTVRFFVDGAPLGSDPSSSVVPTSPEVIGLRLGRSPVGSPFPLDGALDEVRLSKVKRDDAWVHATFSTAKDELIGYGEVQIR